MPQPQPANEPCREREDIAASIKAAVGHIIALHQAELGGLGGCDPEELKRIEDDLRKALTFKVLIARKIPFPPSSSRLQVNLAAFARRAPTLARSVNLQVRRPIDLVRFATVWANDGVGSLPRVVPLAAGSEPASTFFAFDWFFHAPMVHEDGNQGQPKSKRFIIPLCPKSQTVEPPPTSANAARNGDSRSQIS